MALVPVDPPLNDVIVAAGKDFGGSLTDTDDTERLLRSDFLTLFLRLLPHDFLAEQLQQEGIHQNCRIYNARVVLWLMTQQRLRGNVAMQEAVMSVVHGLPAEFWLRSPKRIAEQRVSGNDGSYSTARQELPVGVVERSSREVFRRLLEATEGAVPELGQRAFFVDGTTLRTPCREELKQEFPPASNQHGEAHWPTVKMLVAHDLETGLALAPVWGAMSGPRAVSEPSLFYNLFAHRLPAGVVVVGDINFGVFSVAYAADQTRHPSVLRLQPSRAKAMLRGPLVDGIDREFVWRPSRNDRQAHPDLPEDACVRGRIIVAAVQPDHGEAPFLLVLFTTILPRASAKERRELAVGLYGKRWNLELDLRTLKSTLELEQLTCTSPAMVEKEIQVAMLAYNLVRAVMYAAAKKSGLAPRRYSFTRVRNIVEHFLPFICNAKSCAEAELLIDKMMHYVEQAKLRHPKRRRSYPRAVWYEPKTFPSRYAHSRVSQ
jgi:putative transposase